MVVDAFKPYFGFDLVEPPDENMKIVIVSTFEIDMTMDMYISFSGCIAQNAMTLSILISPAGIVHSHSKCSASLHGAIY